VKKSTVTTLALATAVLLAPAAASAQGPTVGVDPLRSCYRETETVNLLGSGFTPNATPNDSVNISRGATTLGGVPADASGAFSATLRLPGVPRGEQTLTYTATDIANPALVANFSLRVTAVEVGVRPRQGRPNRLLRIRARGFFGGKRLWAHVVRRGRPARTARNLRLGRIKGACKTSSARRRIFPAGVAPGLYRVQFDTFRRYKPGRRIAADFNVRVSSTARGAAAAASTSWARVD
jgi:hypothetical protein